MSGLTEWLTDCVDDDENFLTDFNEPQARMEARMRGYPDHVGGFDHARMMREVAFKRAVLAEHKPHELTPGWSICEECAEFVTSPGSYDGTQEDWEQPPDDVRRDSWPCSTVRNLAAVYCDRPGYAEAIR